MRLACCLLLLMSGLLRATVPMPPGDLPVNVKVSFFLVNLTGMDEKAETFEADIYLLFHWKDERLKHDSSEPLFFAEDAARQKIDEIWSPQLEFVNTAKPEITNENLTIDCDGSVELAMGLTSKFRTDLDLRRFPFDRQQLDVRVTSFTYGADKLIFVADQEKLGFEEESTFEGLRVTKVTAGQAVETFTNWAEDFSEYRALIHVERNTGFYLWTVFGPVLLIFLISCSVYLVPPDQIGDRVSICLTALLACIATQFALSFSLPQISYMTLIDRLFINTYGFVALNVLIVSAEMFLDKRNTRLRKRVNRFFGTCVPIAYMISVVAALIL